MLITAETEGGAHIDKKVNVKTKLLEKGTGRVKYGTRNDDIKKELVDTHYLFLRQIAYEVLLIEKLFTLNDLEFNQPACKTITYNGLLQEAEKFLNEKKVHYAKSSLEKAIKYDANRKEAYNNIGLVYEGFKHIDEAIYNYRQALKVDNDYVDAQYNLGNIYRRQLRYDLALDLYENILLKNPNEYKTKHNRNYIFLRLKEKEEMLYQYKTVFSESECEIYLKVLSYELFENEEFEKALDVLKKRLNLFGDSALLLSDIGAAFIKLTDYNNAKIMFTKAMNQKDIENIEVYLNILEYMLVFEQDINSVFMKKCEDFFSVKEQDIIYLEMFKILFKTVQGENTEINLVEFKSQFIANNIIYDFNDLLVMADINNLDTLKRAIKFLIKS